MSTIFLTAVVVAQTAPEASLWRTIIESFPSDPASLFTLALVVGATALVIVAGRKGGGKGPA